MNRFLNPVYLGKKVFFFVFGLSKIKGNDILLASFPKSGNTWVRFFLCNVISLKEMDGQEVGFPLLDATMPELGRFELLKKWEFKCLPRIVKTHHAGLIGLSRFRHIIIFRDPRDVVVSMFHYAKKKQLHHGNLTLDSIIRDSRRGLEAWFIWHEKWLEARAEGLWISYEDLIADPALEFSRILRFLGVDVEQAIFDEALMRSSIDSVRRSETTLGHSKPGENRPGFTFARSGKSGQWKDYFSEKMLEEFEQLKQAYPACGRFVR